MPIENRIWYNIGRALVTHGYCYCNTSNFEGLTPDEAARAAELMIFEPQMKIKATDYDDHTGGFTLVLQQTRATGY